MWRWTVLFGRGGGLGGAGGRQGQWLKNEDGLLLRGVYSLEMLGRSRRLGWRFLTVSSLMTRHMMIEAMSKRITCSSLRLGADPRRGEEKEW